MDRLDRQVRIEGWDQPALDRAKIGVIGDDDRLASLFLVSASALGINHLVVIAPVLDPFLADTARSLNPLLTLTHWEGFYTHPFQDDLLRECHLIVDLSHYGLANKLLLAKGFRDEIPIVRGFCREDDAVKGITVFTYLRGREWVELDQTISPGGLPHEHFDDGVLDIIAAGIALEEVKNILMKQEVSDTLIQYGRPKSHVRTLRRSPAILVVGAGALGNFVGLGLACLGYTECTFMDPDVVELTNLNRQVLLHDGLGRSKAETLCRALNRLPGMRCKALAQYYQGDTDISPYDVVLDCVDNFETRIILSEKCRQRRKPLISGGTGPSAAQVVIYDAGEESATPAELLGLAEVVRTRGSQGIVRERASCTYRPEPSVVMTNQIAAGFMVDALRMLMDGRPGRNVFYDATSDAKIQVD